LRRRAPRDRLRQRLFVVGVLRLLDRERMHRERSLRQPGVHEQHHHQPTTEQDRDE
jgi:hypothetical protein